MAFDNVVFPLMLERATSSPEFSTIIIPTASGAEQRIGNWLDSRITFNAALGVRSKKDIRTLSDFFRARKGRLRGFLVKDLLDYQAAGDVIAVGDNISTVFQLQRVYSDITTSTAYGTTGNSDIRPIYKPVPSTVTVYGGAAGTTLLTAGGYGGYATANISGGAVTGFTVTNGGSGYTTTPTATISGGGGSGATATVSISGGAITSVNLTGGGSGYTSSPTVKINNTTNNYSIDYKTGLISLTSALPTNHILNWFGEFYIPCRFVDDRFPADEVFYDLVEMKAAGNIPDVSMLEIRDFS